MKLVSRKNAKKTGLLTYFTGKSCKNGHISERRTDNGQCRECCLILKSKRYYSNKEELNAKAREWKALNADKVKAYSKKWYRENKEYSNTQGKAYRKANPEKVRMVYKEWRMNNLDKASAIANKRRAAKLNRTPSWSDLDKIKEVYAERVRITKETGIQHHVDHIIPLQGELVSGLHVYWNLQIIPAKDNLSKSNKFNIE